MDKRRPATAGRTCLQFKWPQIGGARKNALYGWRKRFAQSSDDSKMLCVDGAEIQDIVLASFQRQVPFSGTPLTVGKVQHLVDA